ncbi:hypothetical protein AURDEDRAFT_162307 [Auricularia subglabra TFB-10046 SS5]|nr:hypothetical protein AURDEDRAFT_162307 [Auricularia subglabra TFB-10046 SS5]
MSHTMVPSWGTPPDILRDAPSPLELRSTPPGLWAARAPSTPEPHPLARTPEHQTPPPDPMAALALTGACPVSPPASHKVSDALSASSSFATPGISLPACRRPLDLPDVDSAPASLPNRTFRVPFATQAKNRLISSC